MINGSEALQGARHIALIGQRDAVIVLEAERRIKRPCREFFITSAETAEFVKRRERQLFNLERRHPVRLLFTERHKADTLFLRRLGKRVFERRTRVADALAPRVLRPVDMPERHIVKAPKDRSVHVIEAADHRLFRVRAQRARHKLVREQHFSVCRVRGPERRL